MNIFKFIKAILKFSPRQLQGENKTGLLILKTLKKFNLSYKIQKFRVKIPQPVVFELIADDQKIDCQVCALKSGKIEGKENIISSLINSQFFLEKSNLNFNPACPEVSLANYYFAPAFAVSHKGLFKIIKAKKVKGFIRLKKVPHSAFNILVGNSKNPKVICFAHYDSLGKGATDNASGVAVMMKAIILERKAIQDSLFVFSACEELSFDKPIYWGHGFRVFERQYLALLKNAKKIIIIDCVGNDQPNLSNNNELLKKAFPITHLEKFRKNTFLLYGNIEKLMKVYHSNIDDLNQLNQKFLERTVSKLLKELE